MSDMNAMKAETQNEIAERFEEYGCAILNRSAGAVKYMAVRMNEDSHQNIAAIYGGLGTPATIWVKGKVWERIKGRVKKAGNEVDDVAYTHRGFEWRIFINGPDDPIIDVIVAESTAWGMLKWDQHLARKEAKEARDARRVERVARMEAIKRDPFA